MKIAIAGKGGTGKTTTAYWLAMELAKLQKKVLLVDANEQTGGLSQNKEAGVDFGGKAGLAELLIGKIGIDGATYELSDGVSIVPAGNGLEDVNFAEIDDELFAIDGILSSDGHDIVIIDTAPDLTDLTTAAIVAADHVIVTAGPRSPEIERISDIAKHLQLIWDLGVHPKLSGVIMTRVPGTRSNRLKTMKNNISKRPDYLGMVRESNGQNAPDRMSEDYATVAQAALNIA